MEEVEGKWMGLDGVGDGKGRRRGCTMTRPKKGNSTGGCNVVARAPRAEERPRGGARGSWSTEKR